MPHWPVTIALLGILGLFWLERRMIGGRATLSFTRFREAFSLGCVGATLAALLLQRLVLHFLPVDAASWTWGPVIEELAKASPAAILIIFLGAARWLSVADLALLGMASGLGFEFVESNLRILAGRASVPGPSFLFDTDQGPSIGYLFSGHGTTAALTVLGLAIGFRFLKNPVLKVLPGLAAFAIGCFDHAMYNWKVLHTDFFFGQIQSIKQAPEWAERIYAYNLDGALVAWLVIGALLLASWWESRVCASVLRGRREFLMPGETRLLVVSEWMMALSRAKLGRRPFSQYLSFFRLRRSWALAVADSDQFPDRAEAARRLASRLYKAKEEVVDPVPSDWVPPRSLWWPNIRTWFWRNRWVLITRVLLTLLFILPLLLPPALLHLTNTTAFALVMIGVSLLLTIPRIRSFGTQPRLDPVRMDAESAAARYNRGFLLLASVASSIVAVVNLVLGGRFLLAGHAAFISDALSTWAANGGNPGTLLSLPGLMTTTAHPRGPCDDLRNEVAKGDARIQQLHGQLGGAGAFPDGGLVPADPTKPLATIINQPPSLASLADSIPGLSGGQRSSSPSGGPPNLRDLFPASVPTDYVATVTNQSPASRPLPDAVPGFQAGHGSSAPTGGKSSLRDLFPASVPTDYVATVTKQPGGPARYGGPQAPTDPATIGKLPDTMPMGGMGKKGPGPRPRPDNQADADGLRAEQAAQARRRKALAECEKAAAQVPVPATKQKGPPVDISALKKRLDDAKRQFENLERDLSTVVGADLDGIKGFLQDYDSQWKNAMNSVQQFMRDYKGLATDYKNLVNQFQNRDFYLKLANIADEMLQYVEMAALEGYAGSVEQKAYLQQVGSLSKTAAAAEAEAGVVSAEARAAQGVAAQGEGGAAGVTRTSATSSEAGSEAAARGSAAPATSSASSGAAAAEGEGGAASAAGRGATTSEAGTEATAGGSATPTATSGRAGTTAAESEAEAGSAAGPKTSTSADTKVSAPEESGGGQAGQGGASGGQNQRTLFHTEDGKTWDFETGKEVNPDGSPLTESKPAQGVHDGYTDPAGRTAPGEAGGKGTAGEASAGEGQNQQVIFQTQDGKYYDSYTGKEVNADGSPITRNQPAQGAHDGRTEVGGKASGGEDGAPAPKSPGEGFDTVPGGGENRPPDWETQRLGQNTEKPPASTDTQTLPGGKNSPVTPDSQEVQNYLDQAKARQDAADRVAQKMGYQNADEMQAQQGRMKDLQKQWDDHAETPRIQRIQNQTGETADQVIARSTREQSLVGTSYDPNPAEINLRTAQQQLEKLANGNWSSIGLSGPPDVQQVNKIFNQYQDAVNTLHEGQQLTPDFWSRMPREQAEYLQQQVNNFDPNMRQQWLDRILGGQNK